MHSESWKSLRHDHVFLGTNHVRNERRTWIVIAMTAAMMIAEIIAGVMFGSMALLADGFHMATHAGALSITAAAYFYARRHADDPRFSFGTGKLGELAGYSSAIILAIIALGIGFESVMRLAAPVPIQFDQAIVVATIGLVVNLVSAWVLHEGDGHSHEHSHGHDHHHDHNFRSAYLHVLTDALTSVLAIVGLLVGKFYGWVWMDPLMGIVGGIVIARWSWGLLRGAGAVLLDTTPDPSFVERVHDEIEQNGDRISDLHLWRVGPGHMAAIISLISDHPQPPNYYKQRLASLRQLAHVTIEVHRCDHVGNQA